MTVRVVLGVSGASGAALALDCARVLRAAGAMIELVMSPMAERTLTLEIGPQARHDLVDLADAVHPVTDLGATVASGSFPVAGMIVAPCSMRSLAAIANGLDDNLLTRAAGVQLKERRPLVLLAREAPLTLAHLRNMTAVTEMGGIVFPPLPAFYHRPSSIDELVDDTVERVLALLGLDAARPRAWTGL